VITPEQVMKRYGADILRLWVASSDYSEDVRISDEILTRLADAYRKIRNTFKYLLSNLYDFDPTTDSVAYEKTIEIDRWILSRLSVLIGDAEKNYDSYEFHKVYRDIYNFCVFEVSSVYLDVLKDRMYTAKAGSLQRRSAQTAMFEILSALLKITAPLIPMTSEEAWAHLHLKGRSGSVHLEIWPEDHRDKWFDHALNKKWERLIGIREIVLKSLEEKRQSGEIGSGLESKVLIFAHSDENKKLLIDNMDFLRYLFIVSQVEFKEGLCAGDKDLPVVVRVEKADGKKCQRCWNYSVMVGKNRSHPSLCERCLESI
jgi:isoleucyl-tRNA synthetase